MSENITRRALIVCTAARQSVANTLAFNLTGKIADQQTFAVGLVPITRNPPIGPPTHFWAGWRCTEADYHRIASAFGNQQGMTFRDGDTITPQQLLAELELRPMIPDSALDS
jgi:hypothetical protein